MRQLMFIEPGRLEWQDVPLPELQAANDALVRPIAVARCDLDLGIVIGNAPLPGPFALGHETIGEVVDVGDAVDGFKPGDRVAVPFQISCGTCDHCRRGWTNSCTSVPARACYGMKPLCGVEYGGALSERICVPFADHMLVPIPNGVGSSEFASIGDNIADGWRAVAPHLQQDPGAEVMIMGGSAQSVGLYAGEAARALGAGRVLYVDDDVERLRRAKDLGVEVFELAHVDASTRPPGKFAITVDASNRPDRLHLAVRATAPCGVCTSVGIYYNGDVALPLLAMYTRGITFITGRVHARPDMASVLDFAACGHFHPEKVTSRTVPFSQATEGMLDPGPKVIFENDLN